MRWASMKVTRRVQEWSFKKASPSALHRWPILFLVTLWGSFRAVFLDVRSLRGVGATGTYKVRPCRPPLRQSAISRNALAYLDDDKFEGGSILDNIKALDVEEMREAGDVIDEDLVPVQRHAQELKAPTQAVAKDWHRSFPAMDFLFPEGTEGPDRRHSGTYVDCTFGNGFHTEQILTRLSDSARVFAFDIDPTAVALGRELEERDSRFHIFHRPFADMGKVLQGEDIHGIILDTGTSRDQVETPDRGFSCQNLAVEDRPLDLRFNSGTGESAAEWLQTTSVEELAWVLHHYGPDRGTSLVAERLAQAIMDEQAANGPFTLMGRFAEVIGRTLLLPTQETFEHPHSPSDHPARHYLLAIRIYLNQEREQYVSALPQAFDLLVPGGRCLTNAKRKMESEAVFQFVLDHQEPDESTLAKIKSKRRLRELYPHLGTDLDYSVLLLGAPVKAPGITRSKDERAPAGSFFAMEKGPRHVKRIKAKARLERSRFKQPVITPSFTGAAPEDAVDDEP